MRLRFQVLARLNQSGTSRAGSRGRQGARPWKRVCCLDILLGRGT